MFTGIVQATGRIARIERRGADARLAIAGENLDLADVRIGDSIAVNGVCLTVVTLDGGQFAADVSGETLSRTTLGTLAVNARVNLEKALALGERLGGHLVSGHVDGLGTIRARREAGRSTIFRIAAPDELARYIAEKGSICVDGVSLTVNRVEGSEFEVNIVPHTSHATILDEYAVNRAVNLEADLIARYLERLLTGARDDRGNGQSSGGITRELLAAHGFAPNKS
jgi:riboflavin synthase